MLCLNEAGRLEHRHGIGEFGFKLLKITKSQAVSKSLRQMKECSVFKHTSALQELLARGLQSLRVYKFSTCHLMRSDVRDSTDSMTSDSKALPRTQLNIQFVCSGRE
jgi:hypothetical protein